MEVIYELGEILNGVDVVVGWGGDERNTRLAAPQVGNVWADLLSRKLPPLACSAKNTSQEELEVLDTTSHTSHSFKKAQDEQDKANVPWNQKGSL